MSQTLMNLPEHLPAFDELPINPKYPPRSAWGVFGDDDQIGTLNLLTPEHVAAAARLVERGRVFALNWELELPDPPLFNRAALRHTVNRWDEKVFDDVYDNFNTQSSSQWDGLRHFGHRLHGFYNGVTEEEIASEADPRSGIHHWARRGIAGRGVMMNNSVDHRERVLNAATSPRRDAVASAVVILRRAGRLFERGRRRGPGLELAACKFIIGDLPFLSYRKSLTENMNAVQALMQAGAHAVKLEGATGNTDFIRNLADSGGPVMGHTGLTPQFVHLLGGYRVQGKTDESADRLMEEALALQEAGCFSLVLECVPSDLAAKITKEIKIATISVGAGPDTDGQALVFQYLLGLNTDFKPKFVKKFLNGAELFVGAIEEYNEAVRKGEFPGAEHSFGSPKGGCVAKNG